MGLREVIEINKSARDRADEVAKKLTTKDRKKMSKSVN